ncbi:helix-turn-helix transcriptional regulator [Pediococcus argentinicus]|uniref:helix-turn-helix transcriptional regulator n=1 Tax=Pediococcus argentinicus TaxID=480391 RepID=UPI00338EC24F
MIQIKNRIRETRVANKLSQQDLANAVGVTRQAISQYEQGREPSLERWKMMANLLNVDPAYLVGWQNQKRVGRL